MSRRTQNRNQYESGTTGDLAAGAFSVTVESAAGLITDQPGYFVIEPDVPGQREWIRVESITGNQLNIANPNGRNLTGSDGDLLHVAGSKIRSVPTQQIFEDIFQDAEDDELALTQHQTDGGDPHQQAGYLTADDADDLYVNLVGDTMVGLLILSADPAVAFGAATKQYVDNGIETHTLLPDAHHDAFIQADADALYLSLSGGTLIGTLNMDGNTISGIDDLEFADVGGTNFIQQVAGNDLVFRIGTTNEMTITAGAVLFPNGTVASPGVGFASDPDIGMFREGANSLGFVTSGELRVQMGNTHWNFGDGTLGFASVRVGTIGTAAGPDYTFQGDNNTGMYRGAADNIRFATGGILRLTLANSVATLTVPLAMSNNAITGLPAPSGTGDATRKSYVDGFLPLTGGTVTGQTTFSATTTISGDFLIKQGAITDLGLAFIGDLDTGIFRQDTNQMVIVTGGVGRLFLSATQFVAPSVATDTTGDAANCVVQSLNGRLQRSTSALKYKEDVHEVDGLADMSLRPVAFTHLGNGKRHIGFIADEVAAQDERAGMFNEDGEVENYDLRSVVAILSAKVNRLEAL